MKGKKIARAWTKEDAALIVAAPELLAAAKAAIVHLRACEKGQIGHPFKSASLPMLEKAVAKAEGLKS